MKRHIAKNIYITYSLNTSKKENKITYFSNIVVSGDFNIGDINWRVDPPVATNPQTYNESSILLNYIDDHAFSQHVTEPTRPVTQKTLDLVISSKPSLVSNVQVQPGMSDHDIITFDINTKIKRIPKPPHKIYLYKSMDLEGLQQTAWNTSDKFFISSPETRSVEANWTLFKDSIQSAINTFVPSKLTKAKDHLPWITQTIK